MTGQTLDLAWRLLPDGRVRLDLPPAVARDLLRRLTRDLTAEIRSHGVQVPAGTQRLLYGLLVCAQQADSAAAREPHPTNGFASETTAGHPATVELTVAEAAQRLECSAVWIRRLARNGRLTTRRVGRTWLVDQTSLERYRKGTAA